MIDDKHPLPAGATGRTAHESNAAALMAAVELLGERPERVLIVGIEPAELRTQLGLSERVDESVPAAAARALRLLEGMFRSLTPEVVSCTS